MAARRADDRSPWLLQSFSRLVVGSCRIGFLGSALTTGIVTGQAVNDANRVKRQSPDQLLDNEILVAETKLKKAKARRGGCCSTSERTIEKLEARLQAAPDQGGRNTFDVVVPPGGERRPAASHRPDGSRRHRDGA